MLLSLIQLLAGIGIVLLLVSWLLEVDAVAMATGTLGFVAWALVAYGLFNIETVDSTGSSSEPALALFAVAAAVVTVIPAFVEPFDMIGESTRTNAPQDKL
ncbi:hypothetical protein Hbl1158_16965 (plasmid) [Halobaculum sp. CBA1158]|uniref:hypothetical protein n=1 Tax=Halobaculum sp. CBA1158 TaxID=2904243 RepID=UPI001F3F6E86|nr:hypothetical protein [Halobaculum sp. CBA1158]UIP01746.1 hypothetical protein Hbl1158_16965 [Halobaculum sp. CBA1158]